MPERKSILLRLDPAVHDALARWAADELRSTTAQIEYLLRQGLAQAGRLPRDVGGMPRRGRPPRPAADAAGTAAADAARAGDEREEQAEDET
jgi:hypothetical protein